jgi:hypothetical protein
MADKPGRPPKQRYTKAEYKIIREAREKANREAAMTPEWLERERRKIAADYPLIPWPWEKDNEKVKF